MADDALSRLGPILEQMSARFELVLEAVTGFGGKMESLRTEIGNHFTEVGRQVRFISDRIAENREGNAVTRADLGAEMVRLGEMIGATRVEFREQLSVLRSEISQNADAAANRIRATVADEMARNSAAASTQLKSEVAAAAEGLRKQLKGAALTETLREELSAANDGLLKKIDAELKQTNKALASLSRKFERFDDRITVETRDQDQRLRKLERRTASR